VRMCGGNVTHYPSGVLGTLSLLVDTAKPTRTKLKRHDDESDHHQEKNIIDSITPR
jgi:hypothetical protein